MAQGYSVELDDVRFRYKSSPRWVLDGVGFRVEPGERVLLVGPNGSGKTTLFRLIVGALVPQEGKVLVEGRPPRKLTPRLRRGLSLVLEAPRMPGWLRASEYLEVVAGLRGCGEPESWVIEELGLTGVLGERVSRLSQGYKKRLAVAAAFTCSPRLVLLDEPLSAVDPTTIARVSRLLDAVKGPTILVASHISLDIRWDRVGVLVGGKIRWHRPSGGPTMRVEATCPDGSSMSGKISLGEVCELLARGCTLKRASCIDLVLDLMEGSMHGADAGSRAQSHA